MPIISLLLNNTVSKKSQLKATTSCAIIISLLSVHVSLCVSVRVCVYTYIHFSELPLFKCVMQAFFKPILTFFKLGAFNHFLAFVFVCVCVRVRVSV